MGFGLGSTSARHPVAEGPESSIYAQLGKQRFVDGSAAAYHTAGLLDHCPDWVEKCKRFGAHLGEALANLDKTENTRSGSLISIESLDRLSMEKDTYRPPKANTAANFNFTEVFICRDCTIQIASPTRAKSTRELTVSPPTRKAVLLMQ